MKISDTYLNDFALGKNRLVWYQIDIIFIMESIKRFISNKLQQNSN